MSSEIARSVIWRNKASDVWAELKERLSHANLFRISELQEEIYSFKQRDLSVTKYYTGMKILLDELDVLNPIPVCTCNARCTCGVLTKLKNQRNVDVVVRFLKGLNEQYSKVRSQVMLIDPLPTINKVYSLIAQQERQFHVEHSENSKILVNISESSNQELRKYNNYKGSNHQKFQQQTGKICSHCGRMGHTVDVCYKKHGFPPGFKFKNPKYASRTTNVVVSDNLANTGETSNGAQEQTFGFTAEQYRNLLALLPQNSNENLIDHNSNVQVNLSTVQQHSTVPTHNEFQYLQDDWYN
ncbi:uncharacterized protein LOC113862915 [Abrus precatorius]|uniref:Uncharacterized protein LOC113862915 n=1 Tax=Abrus precatorius TaxID=3816 RepID=A0A8B8L9N3_ABRPR|nr:uncharacterized protein LOC113862915 [Abrus precatorius]